MTEISLNVTLNNPIHHHLTDAEQARWKNLQTPTDPFSREFTFFAQGEKWCFRRLVLYTVFSCSSSIKEYYPGTSSKV